MQGEMHLFVIWEKGRYKEEKILADIAKNFKILKTQEITWSKDECFDKLRAFYNKDLPDKSWNDKVGDGAFLLIIVVDESPLYRIRNTYSGPFVVNVNMFDSKEMYRYWTNGGGKVHATNTKSEFKHDFMFLTGQTISDLMKQLMN